MQPTSNLSDVYIGMPGYEFESKFATRGTKIEFTENDPDSYTWVIKTQSETIWLSGNAWLGGIASTRHHFLVADFSENRLVRKESTYMEASRGNVAAGRHYLTFYSANKSISSCSQYFSVEQIGKYQYVIGELIDSWIHADKAYDSIGRYDQSHGNYLAVTTARECDDVAIFLERAIFEMEQDR